MKKFIIAIIVIIAFLIGLALLLNGIAKNKSFQFFGGLTASVETNEHIVALTFDDGPSANTQKILDKSIFLG